MKKKAGKSGNKEKKKFNRKDDFGNCDLFISAGGKRIIKELGRQSMSNIRVAGRVGMSNISRYLIADRLLRSSPFFFSF